MTCTNMSTKVVKSVEIAHRGLELWKPDDSAKSKAKRLALVVSNGEYKDEKGFGKLKGTTKDNQDITALLSDQELGDFEVTSLLDESLIHVRKAVAEITGKAGEQDLILFYFSGNGWLDKGDKSLYFPVRDSDSRFVNATSIDTDFILSQMRLSKCAKFVLIIDGCYSGAFFNNNRGIPNGLIAITSCGENEMVTETEEGGIFTQSIINGIKQGLVDTNADGRISATEIYHFVRQKIEKSIYQFTPQKWEWNLQEPIYIVNQPRAVFISYDREEQDIVQQLAQFLYEADIRTFVDTKGIGSGEDWQLKLTSEITKARALIFVISKSSLTSKWAKKELKFAESKDVPIFPVHVDDTEVPDWFNFAFGQIQRHSIDQNDIKGSVQKLIDAIQTLRKEVSQEQQEEVPSPPP